MRALNNKGAGSTSPWDSGLCPPATRLKVDTGLGAELAPTTTKIEGHQLDLELMDPGKNTLFPKKTHCSPIKLKKQTHKAVNVRSSQEKMLLISQQ